MRQLVLLVPFVLALAACGGGGSDADKVGVGAQCSPSDPCPTYRTDAGNVPLACLTQFTGGYCGLEGCTTSVDCPLGSICVRHTDNVNYCFRTCVNKGECNRNRDANVESNCVGSFNWAAPADDDGSKACIPPSSGL